MRMRALAAGVLALLPPGAAAAPPAPIGLGVWPARTVIAGRSPQVVHVRNGGVAPVTIDLSASGFALDLRGSPKVVTSRGSARWLAIRPKVLEVPVGITKTFTVWPAVPSGARPGDHPALVLLRTRPPGGRSIGVRVRIGVVVDVRIAGKASRRVALRSVRVIRRGSRREVAVAVANLGDVTETSAGVRLELWAGGRRFARLQARPRELLPHSRGLLEFVYAGNRSGVVRALVVVRPHALGTVTGRRLYRLRV
jgi:hypothetical protein